MEFKRPKNLTLPLGSALGAVREAGGKAKHIPTVLPLLAGQAQDTAHHAAANVRAVMWRIWGARVGRVAVVLAAAALATAGYVYRVPVGGFIEQKIAEASGAKVVKIQVEGATFTDKTVLQQALGLNRGDSLVTFNASAARARLEALPWVRLAAVERQLPDTVRVDVYEHVPLARVDVNGENWVINKDGEAIEPETPAFARLPMLAGQGAAQAAAGLFGVLGTWPNLTSQLAKAEYVGGRRWDVTFASGVTVKLPEDNPTAALQVLAQLEAARHVLTLNAGEIDLRIAGRIVLRLPPEATPDAVITPPHRAIPTPPTQQQG